MCLLLRGPSAPVLSFGPWERYRILSKEEVLCRFRVEKVRQLEGLDKRVHMERVGFSSRCEY